MSVRQLMITCAVFCLVGLVAASPAETNHPLRLALDLSDGSHIIGIPSTASVPVKTSYARMDILLETLRFIKVEADHQTASLELRNGDKLSGVVDFGALDLETIFGKLSIGVEHLHSVEVALGGEEIWMGGEERGMDLDLGGGVNMELVWIPLGSFQMGSPDAEEGRNADREGPVHRVKISNGFWMGKYEVTQQQYEQVMGSNPSKFKGGKNPVEKVNWHHAKAFCEAVTEKTGRTVRLPREAEWEYACRAGTKTRYYTGDDEGDLAEAAWYKGTGGKRPHPPHPVGQKTPNAWGLHDMLGNVREWCEDWHGKYPSGAVTDPTGPATGSDRVLRGGSWYSNAGGCRVAGRGYNNPADANALIGFRVCLLPVAQ